VRKTTIFFCNSHIFSVQKFHFAFNSLVFERKFYIQQIEYKRFTLKYHK